MKEETLHPWIEPELEARIVALVLGEASDFESEELERLIEKKAELAMFRKRMTAVHGLLREVATGESSIDNDDWKLSDEKRKAVLAVIDGEENAKPSSTTSSLLKTTSVKTTPVHPRRFNWKRPMIKAVALAAVIMLSFSVFLKTTYLGKESLMAPQMVVIQSYGESDDISSEQVRKLQKTKNAASSVAHRYTINEAEIASRGLASMSASAAVAEPNPARASSSALSSIQDSLNQFSVVSEQETISSFEQGLALGDDNMAALEFSDSGDSPNDPAAYSPEELQMPIASAVGYSSDAIPELKHATVSARGGFGGGTVVTLKESDLSLQVRAKPEAKGMRSRNAGEAVSSGRLNEMIIGQSQAAYAPKSPNLVMADEKNEGFAKMKSTRDLDSFAANTSAKAEPVSLSMRNQQLSAKSNAKADVIADYVEKMSPKVMNKGRREDHLRQVKKRSKLESPEIALGKTFSRDLAANDKIEINAGAPIVLPAKENKDHSAPSKGLLALNSPLPNSLGKLGKKIARKPDSIARSQTKQQLPAPPAGLNEKNAEDEAFSTFSLHVSDVSFKLAQAALAKGEWPDASKVRIEEFVNAFDYGDSMPNQNEKVASQMEQAIHPFLQQRNLLRVSMRTAAAGRAAQTPLRLTFLLDNSGSMERNDRRETVQRAFALLAQQLKPMDQVTLISFARQPRLIADKVSGAKADQLVKLVANIPSEGGTNLEAALNLAFEKAQEQQLDNAQNRIVMLTDGAANLGDADPERLSKMIENMRDAGIAFDAAGIGADGLNDEILEALTRKGDGRYYLLNQPEDADEGFARQIAGALRPAAKNVKVQIEFNPKRVGKYKLLGFEKHRLKKEDFRNDKVDAAEMAAAEAGVALYQFEAKPDGEGDVGSVSVRFRDLSSGQMIENRWPIPYQADAPRIEQAAPSLQIATSAALLAAKLKGGALAGSIDLQTLSKLISTLPDRQRNNKRVQELQQMLNAARASIP